MATISMSRAYQESARKGALVQKAWNAKALNLEKGTVFTSKLPAWLKTENTEIVCVDDKVEIVRMIFDLYIDKGFGFTLIAKQLNELEIKPFGTNKRHKKNAEGKIVEDNKPRFWGNSSIKKIVHNRAVLGCFTPRAKSKTRKEGEIYPEIPDYFPQIISIEDFEKAQLLAKNRLIGGQKIGNNQRINSVFVGLTYCAFCGGSMGYMNKGKGSIGKLACNLHVRSRGCDGGYNGTKYDSLEHAILLDIVTKNFAEVAPDYFEDAKEPDTDLLAKIEKKKSKREKMIKFLREADDCDVSLLEEINELAGEIKQMESQVGKAVAKKETPYFSAVLGFYKLKDTFENRIKLKSELQYLIKKIVIRNIDNEYCEVVLYFHNGKVREINFCNSDHVPIRG